MRVKIALVVFENGLWSAFGSSGQTDKEMADNAIANYDIGEALVRHWVELNVDVPQLTIRLNDQIRNP